MSAVNVHKDIDRIWNDYGLRYMTTRRFLRRLAVAGFFMWSGIFLAAAQSGAAPVAEGAPKIRSGATVRQSKGAVWKAIDVAPSSVIFQLAPEAGSNEMRTVKITSNIEQPIELSSPQVSNPFFRAVIVTVRPGREFDLQVTPVAPLPAGNVQGFITIKTSSTNLPVIEITALAIVQPLVTATPSQMCLPAGALTVPAQYTIAIQNNSTQAMRVVGASVSPATVRHRVIETQSNRVFHVILTFPAGFQLSGDQPAVLNVKTTLKDMPVLKVPIFQPCLK